MTVWALSDPHLSFGTPNKNMDVFGSLWESYTEKIKRHWEEFIKPDDLVLIPGDISWAMRLEEALIDLMWIDRLPGIKLILKGNHDFWWSSAAKLNKVLPSSIHFLQNNAFDWNNLTFGGARLWDSDEYCFDAFIHFQENPQKKVLRFEENGSQRAEQQAAERNKIFERELQRLELSLKAMSPTAKMKIALTHYPPIGADLKPSKASKILEEHHVDICVFGHLHSLKKTESLFGEARGVRYILTSCDYLDFKPIRVV
ncbi:MAG: metallophosphoesterase [Anaerolineae bacterium]